MAAVTIQPGCVFCSLTLDNPVPDPAQFRVPGPCSQKSLAGLTLY